MKRRTLTVHIILADEADEKEYQSFVVAIEQSGRVRRFCEILSTKNNEEAMIYAVLNGRVVDPALHASPVELTLTRDGTYWDLMK